ncbi:uncharacterized protein LOC134260769 [Saccostrea cucullata]|uniref:uncharacterized protein LOC134260769 n=1 Tax=Saccostrea cuccullata TaxID=36930 RepID=UPI002ED1E06D
MASPLKYLGEIFVCIVTVVLYADTLPSGHKYTYDFNVFPTAECPKNKSAFQKASEKMNCSEGLRYLCAPDRYLASLIEFCTNRNRSPFAKGNCVRLESKGDLNHVNCEKSFTYGCPDGFYFDDEIYRFPSCLEINTQRRCFIADRNCSVEKSEDASITTFTTEYTKTSNGNTTRTSSRSEDSVLMSKLLQFGFSILFLIPVSVLLICTVQCYKKKVYGKLDEAQPFISNPDTAVLESLNREKVKKYRLKDSEKESQMWSTQRRGEVLSLHPEQRSFLYSFIFMDNNIVNVYDEKWIDLLKKIRKELKLEEASKKNLRKPLKNTTVLDLLTKVQSDYKLISSDVLDELCWFFHRQAFQDINQAYDFNFENPNAMLISKFYRSTEYEKHPGEKCFCLPIQYIDKFLDVLGESVLEHITIEDKSIHKKIAERYNLPIEILGWGKDGIKRFIAYLKEGKEPVYHTRGMIIGCAGAGKTTLLGRLKNQTMHEIQHILPTEGLDVHEDVFKIENHRLQYNEEKYLSSFNIPSGKVEMKTIDISTNSTEKSPFRLDSIETENRDVENSFQRVYPVSSIKDINESDDFQDKGVTEKKRISFDINYDDVQQREDQNETITEDLCKEEETRNKDTPQKTKSCTIKSLFPSMSSVSFHGEPTLNLITLLDFAGQCAYYASHQIYLSPMAFYIFVVDMSKQIDKTADEETCDQKDTIFEGWEYRDYYSFWMKSIHLYSGPHAPVILVATHKDKLPEEKIQGVFEGVKRFFLKELKHSSHVREDRIFCVGFPKENVSLESVEEIQKAIVDLVFSEKNVLHWGIELPSSWVIFEKEIQQQKRKAKMISMSQLCMFNEQIHERLQFSESQLKDMLRYFHEIGIVVYFDMDGLRETVILDIQWFVDAFKHVITARTSTKFAKNINDLHETGELHDDLLEEIWMKDESFSEHKDDLLNYMQQLGMIVKANPTNNNVCHIVPCMSRRTPGREIFECYRKSPILCFKLDSLPHFVFLKLAVACMCSPGWGVRHEKDNRKCIYRTCCLLTYDKTVLALYTTFDNCIEVQMLEKDVDQSSMHSKIQIKTKITGELHAIAKTFHTPLHFSLGYRCKRSNYLDSCNESSFLKEDKLKNLIDDSRPVCHDCPITQEHIVNVKDIYFYWNRERVHGDSSESSVGSSFSKSFTSPTLPYKEEKTREFGIERDKGFDSIRSACSNGNLKQFEYELKMFLSNYQDKHLMRMDRDGFNLIHFACEGGNIDILKKLLLKGFKLDTTTYSGRTCLHIAALRKHLQVCEFIVSSQPNIMEFDDKRGGNVVHFAAEGGDVEILKYFISKDVNVKKTTKSERNILHIAVSNNREEMCEFIVETYPELLNTLDEEKWNPLHFAAATGNTEIFKLLSKHNLNVFDKTIVNDSVLHIACQKRKLEMCSFLVTTYPPLINFKNKKEWIPSFSAAAAGDVEILDLLKEKGSNENHHAYDSHTILHIASKYSNYEVCNRIVNLYPEMVHATTARGWNALHMLAAGPQNSEKSEDEGIKIFNLLVFHQADVMKKTKNGSSVLQLACKNKKNSLCEHILNNYKALLNIPGIDLMQTARDTKDDQMIELFENHCKDM